MNVGDITGREAARNPRHTAIADAVSGRRVSFAELERRVDGLAIGLASHPGVRRGDRVAVLAYNCIEYFEVYLAAARAGMVAQGLNWRLALDELERILRSAEPAVLIAEEAFADTAAELARRADLKLLLAFGGRSDGSYDEFVEASWRGAPVPLPEATAADPTLIIYTGGSTGEPKGAVHTNMSCIAAMVNNTVAERIVPSDRYLMLGQMFHSASILAMNYLLSGATVVVVPRFEPRLSLEVMESERITKSLAFPAMINYMLAEAGRQRLDLSSLQNLQYGGAPIAPRVISEMLDVLPCTLIQCYGSTEHVAVAFLSQEDHRDPRRLSSCGREAFLARVRLLDPDGKPVPWDGATPGEIYVDSPANMSGYWRRPDLTSAVIRDGWLGTGDLAVGDAHGYLTLVGRAKDMIITGGENVYAAQVENAIASLPAVLEVAVIGVPDPVWGETVKAFVVLKHGRDAGEDDVREAVTASLGSYQKPRHVEFVAALPKTPAGKVAKHELRDEAPGTADGGEAPLSGGI